MANQQQFITGMTGVYSVAAELSSKGYIVTLTARNAPIVDMMVATPDLKKTFNVQVKSNKPKEMGGTQAYWLVNKEAREIVSPNLVYVFVNLKKKEKPDFYIVDSKSVAKDTELYTASSGERFYQFYRDAHANCKDNWGLFE